MKRFLSLVLLFAFVFNIFTPSAYALSSSEYKRIGNTDLSYKVTTLSENIKLHEIKKIDGEFSSKIYESHAENVIIYDIYENEIHDTIKIYPDNRIEVNGEFLTISTTTVVNEPTSNNKMPFRSTGSWKHTYSTNILGGVSSGYDDDYKYKTVNVMDHPLSDLVSLAESSICTIIAWRANFDIGASLALGLFVYAAQSIKSIEDYADEGNRYLSFSQTTYTNNDVSNALAYYYKHSFKFYSKKDLAGTLIHTNTPVYELYYFN